MFVDDVQNKPLEDVQSLLPQAQLSELRALPSVTEHGACRQVFIDDVQNFPLKLLQAVLSIPHAQSTEFVNNPPMLEQLLPGLQVFVDDVQNNPVEEVQSLVPQAQLSGLATVPLLTEHDAC